MGYSDVYFRTRDRDRADKAIPAVLAALGERRAANMIPQQGEPSAPARAAILDDAGNVMQPAAGVHGFYYRALRTRRDPREILGAFDLAAYGAELADAGEAKAVLGEWA